MEFIELVKLNQEKIVGDIKKLVSQNSIYDKDTVSEEMPYGKNIYDVFKLMAELARSYGFEVNNLDNRVLEIVIRGESDKTFGIMSHLDTVPVTSNWNTDPFTLTELNGKYYGRGSSDDKGPSVMVLWALKLFKEMKLKPKYTIKVLFGGDEERGSSDLEYYFSKNRDFDLGFSPDTDFPIIYLEKSLSVFKMSTVLNSDINTKNNRLLFCNGGEKINVVCDYCEFKIQTINKYHHEKIRNMLNKTNFDWNESGSVFNIQVHGVAAHAKIPSSGTNAIHLAMKFLKNIKFDERINNIIMFMNNYFVDDTQAKKLGIYYEDEHSDTTNNLGMIKFDESNFEIQFNYRSSLNTNLDIVNSKLNKISKLHNLNFEVLEQVEPHYVDKDSENALLLKKSYEQIMGEKVGFATNGGRTYASMCKNTMAFGPLFKDENSKIHSDEESISIKSIINVTAVYLNVLVNLCK